MHAHLCRGGLHLCADTPEEAAQLAQLAAHAKALALFGEYAGDALGLALEHGAAAEQSAAQALVDAAADAVIEHALSSAPVSGTVRRSRMPARRRPWRPPPRPGSGADPRPER